LHGKYEGKRIIYNYKYSKKELEKLKENVLKLNKKESYVMFNNVYMYQNAKEFRSLF